MVIKPKNIIYLSFETGSLYVQVGNPSAGNTGVRHRVQLICPFYSFSYNKVTDTPYPAGKKEEKMEGCWVEEMRKEKRG